MTEYTPLEILEADGASRLHISVVAEDGHLFAEIPLSYYWSGANNLERINHSDNAPDKAKAEFIVIACNTHEALIEALAIELHANAAWGKEYPNWNELHETIKQHRRDEALKLAKGKTE